MTKKTSLTVVIAALLFGIGASAANAQTPSPRSPGEIFINVSAGGQMQDRTFGSSGTFSRFNETGSFEAVENVGRAFVFDATGGYQFGQHLAFSVGIWMASAKAAVAAAAIMPDPVFFGRFNTVTPTPPTGLKQQTLGVNFDIIYLLPLTNRIDLALSIGPTLSHVKQDVGTIVVSPTAQTATIVVESQSKSTFKGGNLGIDVSYKLAERYGLGFFARYAGGEADIPAVSKMKVGGLQVGGGLRYRF